MTSAQEIRERLTPVQQDGSVLPSQERNESGLFLPQAFVDQLKYCFKAVKSFNVPTLTPAGEGFYYLAKHPTLSNSMRVAVLRENKLPGYSIENEAIVYYDIIFTSDGQLESVTRTIPQRGTITIPATDILSRTDTETPNEDPLIGLNIFLVQFASIQ
ncbi:MAG: hypothetical protein WAU07_04645 [Microgenomates group bacterium]